MPSPATAPLTPAPGRPRAGGSECGRLRLLPVRATLSGKAAGLSVDRTLAICGDPIDLDDKFAAIAAVVRDVAGNTGPARSLT